MPAADSLARPPERVTRRGSARDDEHVLAGSLAGRAALVAALITDLLSDGW